MLFDPLHWQSIASLNRVRRGASCVALPDGILITGGSCIINEQDTETGTSMEIFLFSTQRWHLLSIALPKPISWHRMSVMTSEPHVIVWDDALGCQSMWTILLTSLMNSIIYDTANAIATVPSSLSSPTGDTPRWIELILPNYSHSVGHLVF